jgi:demethylmenaquinone methyltransferase / 2-methoxy-6-polyprenyl-1,4-benzoquinol methylase
MGAGMAEAVRSMFAGIAPRYDVTNSVLSLGLHHRWRRRLVKLAQPPKAGSVLDVATGTGDLAFEFKKAVGPKGRVIGLDFCAPMLDRAREKAKETKTKVEFQEGDALDLPFKDATFDVASIAFGVRNVDDAAKCLKELARVVRPGGRVAVLEFGQPGGVGKWPYRMYSGLVVPVVGGLLTGRWKAYRYLHETSSRFPSGPRFIGLMEQTNRFVETRALPLSGGVAYCYLGVVASARDADA